MSIKMKMLPAFERPYEKLEMYGEASLSDSELLAIVIKNGTKEENSISLAQKILSIKPLEKEDSLRFLQDVTIQEFMKIKGIGRVKAIQLKAICELARRMSKPINDMNLKITGPKSVAELFMEELRYERREFLKLVLLNTKNKVIKIINIAWGGNSKIVIHPKDVLMEPVKWGAPRMILVHNHPSGDPTPSNSDFEFTKKLLDAAKIMGIELLDHVIIGDGKFESVMKKLMMD
ncbi:MAG: DNA repair protein RadC [Clostridia bacterium]|nr:DNA repair protein RadC [Clostridia bacterium]